MSFEIELTKDPTKQEASPQAPQMPDFSGLKSEVDNKFDVISQQMEMMSAHMNKMNEFIMQQAQQHQVLDRAQAPEDNEETWWDEFKNKPKQVIQQQADEIASRRVAEEVNRAKSEIRSEFQVKAEIERYDKMTVEKYPTLLEVGSPLNLEYKRVMAEKQQRDPNWAQRPEAVYDAAQIAFARLVEKGEILPEAYIDEVRRVNSVNQSVGDSYSPGGTTFQGQSGKPKLSKSQQIWAQKLGIPQERYMGAMGRIRHLGTLNK
jgi:hypothetical protein